MSKPLCDVVCLSPALWGEGSNKWVHLSRVIACRALRYIFHTSGKSTLDPPNNLHFKLTHCSNSWDHFQPDSAWGTLCSRQLVLGSEMWKMIPPSRLFCSSFASWPLLSSPGVVPWLLARQSHCPRALGAAVSPCGRAWPWVSEHRKRCSDHKGSNRNEKANAVIAVWPQPSARVAWWG